MSTVWVPIAAMKTEAYTVLHFCKSEVWHRCRQAKNQSDGITDLSGFLKGGVSWCKRGILPAAVGLKSLFSGQLLAEGLSHHSAVASILLLAPTAGNRIPLRFWGPLSFHLQGERCSTSKDSCDYTRPPRHARIIIPAKSLLLCKVMCSQVPLISARTSLRLWFWWP